eukprot:4695718-Pyramimonas_sp.AAC.1
MDTCFLEDPSSTTLLGARLTTGRRDRAILTWRAQSFGSLNDRRLPGKAGHRIHDASSSSNFAGHQGDDGGCEFPESDRD